MKNLLLASAIVSLGACASSGPGEPTRDAVTTEFDLGTATTIPDDGSLVTEILDDSGALLAHVDWDLESNEGLMSIEDESVVVTVAEGDLTPAKANAAAYSAWSRRQPEVPYDDLQCGISYSWCETCMWCSGCFPTSYGYDCIVLGEYCTRNSDCRYADGF